MLYTTGKMYTPSEPRQDITPSLPQCRASVNNAGPALGQSWTTLDPLSLVGSTFIGQYGT